MERKKKIIVAVAAVLVLMVGLMAWKKSETKLSGRYKTDQSTQYIYMLPEFILQHHPTPLAGHRQEKTEKKHVSEGWHRAFLCSKQKPIDIICK